MDLDHAIDDVAREITSGSVDADFAGRVSVRIHDADAEGVRAQRVWPRTWLLVPATAGVALLAVFLTRDVQRSPSSVQHTPQSPSSIRLEPDATVATAGVDAVTASAAAVTTVAGFDASRAAALSVARPRDPDFEPLVTAPIETEALDLSPLSSVVPIEIEAIAFERIEIAAMP